MEDEIETTNEEPLNKSGKESNKSATGLIVFFLIVLVVFSAFIFFRERNKIESIVYDYNGFQVKKTFPENSLIPMYQIKLFINQNRDASFITLRNDPISLENITIEDADKIKEVLLKDELFITMEPNATAVSVIAATEISKIIGNPFLFNIPSHGALLWGVGNNASVKTCADVTSNVSIIKLQIGEENKVFSEKECVIVQGIDEANLIKSADRLSFSVLEIMS